MFIQKFINSFLNYLVALTLFTPLQGMESVTKSDLVLYKKLINKSYADLKIYCGVSNNLDNIIDVAEKSGNGHLMASLIQICLPPEVVQKHIAPHLSEPLAMQYKHILMSSKQLNTEAIDGSVEWSVLPRHDGTYSVVPGIASEYAMWNEIRGRRFYSTYDHKQNKRYIAQLQSITDKKGVCHRLDAPCKDNPEKKDKKFMLCEKNQGVSIVRFMNFGAPVHSLRFSSDCTLLAGMAQDNVRGIFFVGDMKTCESWESSLNGSISALCSAHHSPLFVAGSNHDNAGLVLFKTDKEYVHLPGQHDPITWVEFSPDDKWLLSCSYQKEYDRSMVKLWDTSAIDTPLCIATSSIGYDCPVYKAFFICDGKKIMVMQENGHFHLLDGLTGESIKKKSKAVQGGHALLEKTYLNDTPIAAWSSKNKLIFIAFCNRIFFFSSETGESLGCVQCLNHRFSIFGIGLSADENTIVFSDNNEEGYRLPMYEDQELKEVDFIKNQATITQLYEMLAIDKRVKNLGKRTLFSTEMRQYIQEIS